jgi:hypothetical protein
VRRRALPDPGVQGDGRRTAHLADVDDPVPVEDREVHRLADVGGQRLAGPAALVREVTLHGERAGQAHDAEPEPVLAAVGELLDEPAALQHGHQPRGRRLVHAELAGDLGDAGDPARGEDLQHRQRPVDRLHEGSGARLGHARRLGRPARPVP